MELQVKKFQDLFFEKHIFMMIASININKFNGWQHE